MTVDFQKGGTTDLTFKFDFPSEQEETIRRELETRGRSTPTFECGFYDEHDELVTSIKNVVAIRRKGYIKASTPPADDQFASKKLEKIETKLRELAGESHARV